MPAIHSAKSSEDESFQRKLRYYRPVAAGLIALAAIGSCIPQISRRDGDPEVFVSAARVLLRGGDIYSVASPHGRLYYYPPFFAVLNVPLIPLPVVFLISLWCAVSVVLLGWSMAAFYSGLTGRPFFSLPAKTRWTVCTLSTLLTLRFTLLHLRFGQTNIFVLALVVLGLTWLTRKQKIRSGIAIGLSMLIKLTTLPFALWFAARRAGKVILGITLGALIAVAMPALIAGLRQDADYHLAWVKRVALTDAPGTGNWSGIGNVSLRAQADRFFLDVDAFSYRDRPYRATIVSLPNGIVRLIGYLMMLGISLLIVWYAVRFRNAPRLVSEWGGFAFVFTLIPNFSPVTEIPHLVLLIPAYLYVVHVWHSRLTSDRIFRGLVLLSFVFSSLTTKSLCGLFISQVLTAWGFISLGMLFLSAAVWRSAVCLDRPGLAASQK